MFGIVTCASLAVGTHRCVHSRRMSQRIADLPTGFGLLILACG